MAETSSINDKEYDLLKKIVNNTAFVSQVVSSGSVLAKTAAVTNVTNFTVGSSDGLFSIYANVNCTRYVSGNFSISVIYTNESGSVSTVAIQGHFTSGYTTTISGVGSFEGQPITIRAKAGTNIAIKTSGTFTNLTYSAYGAIIQIA